MRVATELPQHRRSYPGVFGMTTLCLIGTVTETMRHIRALEPNLLLVSWLIFRCPFAQVTAESIDDQRRSHSGD